MEQLGLLLANRLSYSSRNYFEHAGVRECLPATISALTLPVFSICFITGAPRSGKTHFSIKLSDLLVSQKKFPRVVEGEDFAGWLKDQFPKITFSSNDVVIVDDADRYLSEIRPGLSGPFVHFIETLRVAAAHVVLLSGRSIHTLQCDEHVKSRLLPGEGFQISSPSEEDMVPLIKMIAEQRGYKLKERKLGFLVKRLRRDIGSIEDYFERVSHLSRILGQRIKYPLLGDAI